MAYFALYRQWRPKDFSHVVGQRAVIDTLRNQVINDRIAHAYLFCGSRGTGKTSTAKILAKAINCEHPVHGDPCGNCSNCLRLEHDESLDVVEIDAASNNGVDEIRDLRDSVKYPPQYGRYRVYIIDEVHMLSTSAFNALLKTLEEPPAHIVFILATTEPQKLPETILSRCQRFDFGRISVSDIQKRLREASDAAGASISDGALMLIARAAEGGMRDALSILDMCLGYGSEIDENKVRSILGTCDRSFLFEFVHSLGTEDSGNLFRMIDRIMRDGNDPAVFIRDVSYHLRCLLLAKSMPDDFFQILETTPEDAADYLESAKDFSISRLMRILDLFLNAEGEMRYASSPRLTLENVCLKACIRTSEPDSRAIEDRIEALENKIDQLIRGKLIVSNPPESSSSGPVPAAPVPAGNQKTQKSSQKSAKPEDQNFNGIWKETMTRLRKSEPALWSMLTQGNVSCVDDHIVQWQPQKQEGAEFFIGTLNNEEKKKKITDCLNDISGSDRFSFAASVKNKSSGNASDDSDQAYLNNLYNTFGKEPVDIVEEI